MAVTPPAVVAGASRTPLPFGLFSVVPFREGSTDRWLNGVIFEALGCVDDFEGIGEIVCPDPEDDDNSNGDGGEEETTEGLPLSLDSDGLITSDTFQRFTITESYKCSPIGNTLEIAEQVARARMEAWEELRVEEAISTAILGLTPNFADDSSDAGTFASLVDAIGALEVVLGSDYGSQGILHMNRATAIAAFAEGVLTSSGQRLRTALGTPVVAGAGYDFSGVIATPAMFGYRSEIYSNSNVEGDLLDRKQNNLYGVAHRDYLLAIDDCDIWHADLESDEDEEEETD